MKLPTRELIPVLALMVIQLPAPARSAGNGGTDG